MIIKEQLTDIEIKYLFIRKWVWSDSMMIEEFQGHPRTGRVYRAIFNDKTGNYKVLIGETFLAFNKEDLTEDLVEITLNNLLDFQFHEEDLDLLNSWIESDNKDIKAEYEPPIQQGLTKLRKAMDNQEQEEANAAGRAVDALMELYMTNTLQFEILLELATILVSENVNSMSDPAYGMTIHKTRGLGINIARSVRALGKYASDDRRTNERVEDLYDAIVGVVTELERKISNNLID